MDKITSGEWYSHIKPQENKAYIGAKAKYYVAEIIGNDRDISEVEANAALIAAAPKMYEAIQYYLSVLDEVRSKSWRENPDHVGKKMLEAIEKAELYKSNK